MIARPVFALVIALSLAASSSSEETGKEASGRTTFGQRQLAQMLDDRPDMRGILAEDHPIYGWVAEGFNGDRFGERIYWLATSPGDGHPSDCFNPWMDYPPFVRLTAGAELTPIEKWTCLVFELHNVEGSDEFSKLWEQAVQGAIDGDEYAKGCVGVELKANIKTAAFLRANPLPPSPHGRDEIYKSAISFPEVTLEEYRAECEAKNLPFGNYEHYLNSYNQAMGNAAPQPEQAAGPVQKTDNAQAVPSSDGE